MFFSFGVLKYVVCLCKGCDGCCILCMYCDGGSCRCLFMKRVSVSSCRCCMFVSCVHYVAVINAAFRMTCSLLMLIEDTRGDHRADHMTVLYSKQYCPCFTVVPHILCMRTYFFTNSILMRFICLCKDGSRGLEHYFTDFTYDYYE